MYTYCTQRCRSITVLIQTTAPVLVHTPRQQRTSVRTYLVSLAQPERRLARVLHSLADERVATREQQRLLDAGRVVADDVDHQLDAARVANLPAHNKYRARAQNRADIVNYYNRVSYDVH